MILTLLTVSGSLASLIALLAAVTSASSWSRRRKVLVLSGSLLAISLPNFAYFRQLHAKAIYGEFEWQWAGDSWIGSVTIEKNKAGKAVAFVDVKRLMQAARPGGGVDYQLQQVMRSSSEGAVYGDKSGFKLVLPVLKKVLDQQTGQELESHEILEADLAPTEAYAGIVRYISENGQVSRGDMVLTRYRSGARF